MKLHRYDLEDSENPHMQISQAITFENPEEVAHDRYLDIKDIYVEGHVFFDEKTSEFIVGLDVEATVTVPCAITLRPIEIDVEAKVSETFVFDINLLDEADEDTIWVEGLEIDLWPFIWSTLLSEIPLKVVDPELEDYPEGDGWKVMTEEDYIKEKEEAIDPRLEILKDFKFE